MLCHASVLLFPILQSMNSFEMLTHAYRNFAFLFFIDSPVCYSKSNGTCGIPRKNDFSLKIFKSRNIKVSCLRRVNFFLINGVITSPSIKFFIHAT